MEACSWMGFKSALELRGRERWPGPRIHFKFTVHLWSSGSRTGVLESQGTRVGARGSPHSQVCPSERGSEEPPPSPESPKEPSHSSLAPGTDGPWMWGVRAAERSFEAVLCCPDGSPVSTAGALYREEGVTRDGTLAQPAMAGYEDGRRDYGPRNTASKV